MHIKRLVPRGLFFWLLLLCTGIALYIKPPILQKTLETEGLGPLVVAQPLWYSKGLALVFVDTQKFTPTDLTVPLAKTGVSTAVIDLPQFINGLAKTSQQCLDANNLAEAINTLAKRITAASADHLIVAGLAEGALIPLINAQIPADDSVTNLSIGFDTILPPYLILCSPLTTLNGMAPPPVLFSQWHSVWTYQPPEPTIQFIRSLANVDTGIAAFNTPFDKVLLQEVEHLLGNSLKNPVPLPIVEVTAKKPRETVTIFYSGDGGWQDLDKLVANEMAALDYPVVGVDILRYCWQRVEPEKAVADLVATMQYYREHWGAKSFVLTGFSFGADLLPVLYNRLPKADQDNVALLNLISLGTSADFEVHVAGWLGQGTGEMPLAPELAKIPANKILCIYGKEERSSSACTRITDSKATVLEMPGAHHFDEDYPKLARQILTVYQQHGVP